MPLLSIIVPVYNKEKYIDSSITSILQQSCTYFELLLIDDGSTDGSGQRCQHYADTDSRVRVFSQVNQGVSAARNKGLELSTGTYVGFIDGDDAIEPDMYETLLNNIAATQADISVCGMQVFHTSTTTVKSYQNHTQLFNRGEALSALLTGTLEWSANNKIYRAALAKSTSFEGRVNEDLDYTFRVLLQADKVVFTDSPKYHYIKRDNSVSLQRFNDAQMESIRVSRRILDTVQQQAPSHVAEARALDFGAHISLLNMILLASKKQYQLHYQQVTQNLAEYASLAKHLSLVSIKQKYAFRLFSFNPELYAFLLRSYCYWFASEVGKKSM